MNKGNTIKNFTDLIAWQQGHKLVLMVYKITKEFPKDEQFGLTSQMRRCAVSITSNIAEGFSKQSNKEKVRFYSIAHGSLTELQNQLLIATDIELINKDVFNDIAEVAVQTHKLISVLIKSSKYLNS